LAQHPTQPRLVSIVDDDAAVRTATASLIRSLGHAAAAYESAESYLAGGDVARTACLITDVQMPGMNGLELQERLRADGYDMPIVFISGVADARQRARALADGAIGFLPKPYDAAMLIDVLETALRGSSARSA
jgi:FixJ family two-component response regulator